jgi:hypothetical protein
MKPHEPASESEVKVTVGLLSIMHHTHQNRTCVTTESAVTDQELVLGNHTMKLRSEKWPEHGASVVYYDEPERAERRCWWMMVVRCRKVTTGLNSWIPIFGENKVLVGKTTTLVSK